LNQTNIKELELKEEHPKDITIEMHVKFSSLKERLGNDAPAVVAALVDIGSRSIKNKLDKKGAVGVEVHGKKITITGNDVEFKIQGPKGTVVSEANGGTIYLHTDLTEKLIGEGIVREVMRRIQDMRKEMKLKRHQKVNCVVQVSGKRKKTLENFKKEIEERCGCELSFGKATGELVKGFKVRKTEFKVGLKKK
jgi:isoleucyl-tRNA synthetase